MVQHFTEMRIVGLRPKSQVTIKTVEKDGRFKDELVTTQNGGEDVAYFVELLADGLKTPSAGIMMHCKGDGNALVRPILLRPQLSWKDNFTCYEVPDEHSEWIRVCITLAQRKFLPWIDQPNRALARAEHWLRTGDFEPIEIEELAWAMATSWTVWRKKRLAWKECVDDLQKKCRFRFTGDSEATFNAAVERIRKLRKKLELNRDW